MAQYLREWSFFGTGFEPIVQPFEEIEGFGKSFFWYCRVCRFEYASIRLIPADGTPRIWQGVQGICPDCPGNKWSIPGSIEEAARFGAPKAAFDYQLRQEIAFLDSPCHPHKESSE